MKLKFTLLFFMIFSFVNAQVTSFATKESMGNDMTSRKDASMVALNNKLYILGGYSGIYSEDFSEYNPVTGEVVKLKKYTRAGNTNLFNVFLTTVNNKIYAIGDSTISKYDFSTNSWSSNIQLGTPAGFRAVKCFVIADVIYILSKNSNLFYAYNTITGIGLQKSNYPMLNIDMSKGFAFNINSTGYIGGVFESLQYNNFYEYVTFSDSWIERAPTPIAIENGIVACLDGKAFTGTGFSYTLFNSKHKSYYWYEYSPSANTWLQRQNFMGYTDILDPLTLINRGRANACAAVIGFDIFLFGGLSQSTGYNNSSDRFEDGLYKYNTIANNWSIINGDLGKNRTEASGFFTNGKVYVGGGHDNESLADFWEYDTTTNIWNQKTSFPDAYYQRTVSELAGKGYFIGGISRDIDPTNSIPDSKYTDELLQYDPLTDTWTTKSPYPAGKRWGMTSFAHNNKLYFGFGSSSDGFGGPTNNFYQYDTVLDSWVQKSSAPFSGQNMSSFVIGNIGYVISYNPNLVGKYFFNSDQWITEPHSLQYNDQVRNNSAFIYNDNAYVVVKGGSCDILAKYNPTTFTWSQVTNLPFKNYSQTLISANNGVYFGFGAPYNNHPERISNVNDWRLLKFDAAVSNKFGTYQPTVNWSASEPFLCGSGNIAANASHSVFDENGDLFSAFIAGPNGNNVPCYKVSSVDLSIPFKTEVRNFGNNMIESGMYLNKSFYFPTSGLNASGILRLYYTTQELNKLVSDFNNLYSANKTISDIKLVRCFYNGLVYDSNPLNNTGDYAIFNSTITNYGTDKYFDINVNSYLDKMEIYAVLLTGKNLSNANFSNQKIAIYPNPVSNILTISIDDSYSIERLMISDILGKKVMEQTSNDKSINIQKLAKGIYIIEIQTTNGIFKEKLIKE